MDIGRHQRAASSLFSGTDDPGTFISPQELIRLATLKATGANVHKVKSLCATYLIYTKLIENDGSKETMQQWRQLRLVLLRFISLGELPRHL